MLSVCGSFWSQGLKIQRFGRQSESGLLHPSSWPAAAWIAYFLSNAQLFISSLWNREAPRHLDLSEVGTLLRHVPKYQEMVQIFNLRIVSSSFISREGRNTWKNWISYSQFAFHFLHTFLCSCVLFFLSRSSYPRRELQWCALQMHVSEIAQIPSQHSIMTFKNIQIPCLQMTSKWAGTETRKCLGLADKMCQEQGYLNPIIPQNLVAIFFLLCGTLFHTRAFDQGLTWTKIKGVHQLGQCQMYHPAD